MHSPSSPSSPFLLLSRETQSMCIPDEAIITLRLICIPTSFGVEDRRSVDIYPKQKSKVGDFYMSSGVWQIHTLDTGLGVG